VIAIIFGFDIDNTITDTLEKGKEYVKLYNSIYNDYHELPDNLYNDFFNKYYLKIISEAKLKDGVINCLTYLRNKGYKIVLITKRGITNTKLTKECTLKYLDDNNVIYDEIVFNSCNKGYDANKKHVNLFVDDNENYLDSFMDYPKIKVIKFDKSNNESKYMKIGDWNDLLKYFIKEGY
jgi:uncharacterized HAD superfamily protein